MRGAQPDAECARCGATYPPSFEGGLVTCTRCGLVFAPHEVLHRSRRRPEAPGPGVELVVDPAYTAFPAGGWLAVRPDRLDASMRGARWPVVVALAPGLYLTSVLPWTAPLSLVAGFVLWLNRITLTVAGDELVIRQRPIPFRRARRLKVSDIARVVSVALAPGRADVLADMREGRIVPLLRGVPLALAEATARSLTQRLANAPAVG